MLVYSIQNDPKCTENKTCLGPVGAAMQICLIAYCTVCRGFQSTMPSGAQVVAAKIRRQVPQDWHAHTGFAGAPLESCMAVLISKKIQMMPKKIIPGN